MMTKALLKKQMLEVFSWLYKDRKTGKMRSAQGILMYVILYLFIFVSLGASFFPMAQLLCGPLVGAQMGWVYWCLLGLMGLFLGVVGSVFSTYTTLYQAKDNDFLLSLPIPVSRILLMRLLGVYALALMYELIIMVPAVLVWFLNVSVTPAGVICVLLIPFVLAVLALVLSAVLGWVVALVASRLKHKNIITVLLSLGFIAAYYYVYSRAYSMIQTLLVNAQAFGQKIRTALYPLYQMGLAAEGNLLSMAVFTAIAGMLFLIVYVVLSRSFLGLATANRGSAKKEYRHKNRKAKSAAGALLQKELLRFTGSANYMLNCGLGMLFMPIAAVLLVWKADMLREILTEPFLEKYIPLLAAAGICMVATMNDMTAASVSLEGKHLWVLQSFPVRAQQVLAAKLKLQLLLTVIPAIPLVAAVLWLLQPDLCFVFLIPAAVLLFIVLMAAFGLAVNLKMPILNWTNEIVPIKQSMSVMVGLFGGWVILLGLGGIYYLAQSVISPALYMALVCVLMLALIAALLRWLFTAGSKIFSTL